MVYNPENTLIICDKEKVEWVKEIATGYTILQLPNLCPSESMIIEGAMRPLTKKDNEPGYDFKFIEEKVL